MKLILLLTIIVMNIPFEMNAQVNKEKNNDRVQRAGETYKQLFNQDITPNTNDPELFTIMQRMIFGEVFYAGELDVKTRELITVTTLAVNQMLPQLKAHTNAALNVGVLPVEIKESIYQLAPFIGFPRVLNALDTINAVFTERGISLPLKSGSVVNENNRLEKGLEQQKPLYGTGMKEGMKEMPGGFDKIIPDLLTTSLFADFYTRPGLDLKRRELLIYCALATVGGTERQMASHAVGNLKAGNTKEDLVAAMVQCYPYIGFPRISNALNIIKEAKQP